MKIVLMPGLDGTGLSFKPFIDVLPMDMEPLVISYPSNRKLNYGELGEFVMEQLPEHEEYILVGESFSGPVAYQLALRHPQNLKAVVFVASFLSNSRKLTLGLLRFLPVDLLLSESIPKFITKPLLLGTGAGERLINLLKQSLEIVPANVLLFRLGEIANLHIKHQHCNTRAIYIQATNDRLVPPKCVAAFKEVMENMRIFQVNDPHFILQANPAACAEIIADEVRLIRNDSATHSH